ncbi:transmembrane protein 132D, partial [Tachysurus ichikawai]
NSDILNTAVLNGKMVSVPVKVLGVETDGFVSDITNSTGCSSTDEDTLKVLHHCCPLLWQLHSPPRATCYRPNTHTQ